MNIAMLILSVISCIVSVVLLCIIIKEHNQLKDEKQDNNIHITEEISKEVSKQISTQIENSEQKTTKNIQTLLQIIQDNIINLQKSNFNAQSNKLNDTDTQLNQKINNFMAQMQKEISEIKSDTATKLDNIQKIVNEKMTSTIDLKMKNFGDMLASNQKQASEAQRTQIANMSARINQILDNMNRDILQKQDMSAKALNSSLKNLEERFKTLESGNMQKLENIQKILNDQLANIREENQKKLDSIQSTVNEKLETQLQKSFKTIADQLETVHKSLGEMQSISFEVKDLSRVLSNVKTRGIVGEIQLGNILEEILPQSSYDTNVATIKGSSERVEYAIKLPGSREGETIYLPIDSKFPGDTYRHLLDAYDSGDKAKIAQAKKDLTTRIKASAKDISTKYVSPPDTTNFGIMFLPFEGLYAEVVILGLIEELQRDYHVNICGPSTMAALLNSLQMGFKTLVIQKKTDEVWKCLAKVKSEFTKFEDVLEKAQKQIAGAGESLDKLIGTRTRAINRELQKVSDVPEIEQKE